jgi:uncharacterized protein
VPRDEHLARGARSGLNIRPGAEFLRSPNGDVTSPLELLSAVAKGIFFVRLNRCHDDWTPAALPANVLQREYPQPMRAPPVTPEPPDAATRRSLRPVICYPVENLPGANMPLYLRARETLETVAEVVVPPREGRCFQASAGHFFRIHSVEGAQVGDLNLWNAGDLSERFYSGKTRALHATHLSIGDRLWSCFPSLRPMATITRDTLDWYGVDEHGCRVHDVIGTRCDPYTHNLLTHGGQYHHCCHSNLTRALASETGLPIGEAERHVHDVLNLFMCTGFAKETGQYLMKASPVRPGDYLELFAEIDLLGALSACPGGDCSSEHSSDVAICHPLRVEILKPAPGALAGWKSPSINGYSGDHSRRAPTELLFDPSRRIR